MTMKTFFVLCLYVRLGMGCIGDGCIHDNDNDRFFWISDRAIRYIHIYNHNIPETADLCEKHIYQQIGTIFRSAHKVIDTDKYIMYGVPCPGVEFSLNN